MTDQAGVDGIAALRLNPKHIVKLATIADELASGLVPVGDLVDIAKLIAKPVGMQVIGVAYKLCELMVEITEADVGYCQIVGPDDVLELVEGTEHWADDVHWTGVVPEKNTRSTVRVT